jgi:hypothetical protein
VTEVTTSLTTGRVREEEEVCLCRASSGGGKSEVTSSAVVEVRGWSSRGRMSSSSDMVDGGDDQS